MVICPEKIHPCCLLSVGILLASYEFGWQYPMAQPARAHC